jgi:hypothetical protein
LIAAGGASAEDANRVQLVDDLGNSHEFRHRTKGFSPKVSIGSRHDYPTAPACQRSNQWNYPIIHELGFVDRDDVRRWIDLLADLGRGISRNRLNSPTIVTRDCVYARVSRVEMRLEHLDFLARDDSAPDATD